MFGYSSKKMAAMVMAACFAMSGVTAAGYAFAPSQAEAKMASPEQERKWAKEAQEDDAKKYRIEQSEPGSPLRHIQDQLIKYNSDRLNYDDGKHDRWLEPVWLGFGDIPTTGWSQGGYVMIPNKTVTIANGRQGVLNHQENVNNDYNIYNNSNIAETLAHEFAHFANNDSHKGSVSKSSTSIACELKADATAREFLANVPEYSMGSQLPCYAQGRWNGVDRKLGYKTHPSDQERFRAIADDVRKISNGRVSVDEELRLTVDGKLFMGTGYVQTTNEADKNVRTAYLAGQIATCIQKGIWNRDYIAHRAENKIFADGRPDKVVLAMWDNPQRVGAPKKILGTFDFDERKPKIERSELEQTEVDTLNYIMDLTEN